MKKKNSVIAMGACVLLSIVMLGCGEPVDGETEESKTEISTTEETNTEEIQTESVEETKKVKAINEIERGGVEYSYDTENTVVQGDLFLPVNETVSENAELILIYSNDETNLYYCKENIISENNVEYILDSLVLEHEGKRDVFQVGFDYDYMIEGLPEDSFPYAHEDDYDGDGVSEIAISVTLDYGSGGMLFEKIFIIDYNNESNRYELYCIGIVNFSDVLDSAVIEYYKNQFGLDYYISEQKKDEYKNSVSNEYMCYMGAENGNPVKYGDSTKSSVSDDKFLFWVTVHEAYGEDAEFPEEAGAACYYWLGECSFEVSYTGSGLFAVKPIKYFEFGPA